MSNRLKYRLHSIANEVLAIFGLILWREIEFGPDGFVRQPWWQGWSIGRRPELPAVVAEHLDRERKK